MNAYGNGKGGATETVQEEITGAFFYEQSFDALIAGIERCKAIASMLEVLIEQASELRVVRFSAAMGQLINRVLARGYQGHRPLLAAGPLNFRIDLS